MHVLATAGHVDHGKSTLVHALTGMQPDRLAEERRRGLTIELGYAWTTLDDGTELAFVDVPGHERFIATMLAGLGPVPGVLFVVAADAGWGRQSGEHLAAIDALQLRHGLLAVTRSDLADPSAAMADARSHLARSSLGEVPAVAVSGRTGAGIEQLRTALTELGRQLPTPDVVGPVRLWVDRVFTVRGAGTVVTGTLSAASIAVGDLLFHDDRRLTVRGVHSLGEPRDRVDAVARVAVNLRGVAVGELGRGDVLLGPGRWHHTHLLDVALVGQASQRLPAQLILHVGTAAVPVRVRPLGDQLVRLVLPRPLPVLAGERAVLRDPTRHAVAAGVLVLDADPPALRRRGAAADRGRELAAGRPNARAEVERRGAVERAHLEALRLPLPSDGVRVVADWLVTDALWHRWVTTAPVVAAQWAEQHSLEPAIPHAALRRALDLPADDLLVPVLAAAGLDSAAGRVSTSAASSALGPAEQGVRAVEALLAEHPFRAPERAQLAELGLGHRELAAAQRAHRLLLLAADIALLPDAPQRALTVLGTLRQPFTISAARQALDTTRRVAIPLLEHLDHIRGTVRIDSQLRRVRVDA